MTTASFNALPNPADIERLSEDVSNVVPVKAELVKQLSVYVALAYEHHSSINLDTARERLGISEGDANTIATMPEFNDLVGLHRRDTDTLFKTVCKDAAVDGAFLLAELVGDGDVHPQTRLKAAQLAIEQSGMDTKTQPKEGKGDDSGRFIVTINLGTEREERTITASAVINDDDDDVLDHLII